MRKLKIFVTVLIFTACSGDSALDRDDSFHFFLEEWNLSKTYESGCPSVMDAIKYPEYMSESELTNFVIEDETIRSMSTCGLLETLLDHPYNRLLGPWCTICSNNNLPGITMFNSSIMENPIAIELFKREDCFSALTYKYLLVIKEKKEHRGQIAYLEMLLASDLCMLVLTESAKIQLVAMALEKAKNKSELIRTGETNHIMAVIMRDLKYTPFLDEVGTEWVEWTFGYVICQTDVVEKYAKEFLKTKNIK